MRSMSLVALHVEQIRLQHAFGRGGRMALEGPSLRYVRGDENVENGSAHSRALRLAREIEELLDTAPQSEGAASSRAAHSKRMARAMAASLVDELSALVRGTRTAGSA
jgi:hypothetical protein